MSEIWLWSSFVLLGAFHGVNPAMGWLFAVGLGLQHKSRTKVVWSLVPIGLGHFLSIAMAVAASVVLRDWIDLSLLQRASSAVLIAFGVYRLLARHRAWRTGMQPGFGDLLLWSFLSATGHGAGLMLLPLVLQMPHSSHAHAAGGEVAGGATATIVHSAAALITTGVIAIAVYEWFGLAFLRRGWINLDWVWGGALIAAGTLLMVL